ncbi:MAG: MFS transporter, partial [Streptosporangiaceae bacterium]
MSSLGSRAQRARSAPAAGTVRAGSLLAGSIVDAMDRRRLLMVAQVLMAGCSAGRNAIVPNMVRRSEVSTANAIFQALFQLGLVADPAVAGLLLAGAGVRFVYWLDVASFGVAVVAVFLISPQPAGEPGHRPGLRSRSSPGAPPSPASGWCRGCPPPWRCSPSRAAPTSSRRCSAARSSSSPCRMRSGDAWRAADRGGHRRSPSA